MCECSYEEGGNFVNLFLTVGPNKLECLSLASLLLASLKFAITPKLTGVEHL